MRFPETMLIALLGGLSVGEAPAPASGADDPSGRPTAIGLPVSGPRPRGDGDVEPQPPLEPAVARGPGHRTEEVRFRCGTNTLAGVLVLPETPGPYPAIAFVLGSGPADRSYYGMAPHLWGHFARHGFACLAWDKPGVGQSTGDCNAQTFRDRADEALAAVRFLGGRAEVSKDRVGLWGHSQGGAVAPLAASLSGEVAFLIEVGGSQVVAWQQDIYRIEAELRADGYPEEDIREAVAFARKRMGLIRGQGEFEDLEKAHAGVERRPWFKYAGRCDRALFYSARRMVEFDPGPVWEKVRCPVLAIYGEKDTSLPAEKSLPIIRRGLEVAGNRDATIRVFPGADHGLRNSVTGGPKEAREPPKATAPGAGRDFAPGYLDLMTDWLTERFGPGRRAR
jgi:pimeloyl-ACP methyl ester carboxylesterase